MERIFIGFGIASVVGTIAIVVLTIAGFMPRKLESQLARAGRSTKDFLSREPQTNPWNWHVVDTNIYLGRLPRTRADIDELVVQGVGAIVTLNETWELRVPSELFDSMGIQWLHLPTPDYFSPTIADIQLAVLFIEHHVNSGQKVYIHCNAGVGRSAVITVAYLVHRNHWTLKQAYTYLKSRRSVVSIPTKNWYLRPHWRRLGAWYRILQQQRHMMVEKESAEMERDMIGTAHVEEAALALESMALLKREETAIQETAQAIMKETADFDVGEIVDVK